jgi:hypothetical protein
MLVPELTNLRFWRDYYLRYAQVNQNFPRQSLKMGNAALSMFSASSLVRPATAPSLAFTRTATAPLHPAACNAATIPKSSALPAQVARPTVPLPSQSDKSIPETSSESTPPNADGGLNPFSDVMPAMRQDAAPVSVGLVSDPGLERPADLPAPEETASSEGSSAEDDDEIQMDKNCERPASWTVQTSKSLSSFLLPDNGYFSAHSPPPVRNPNSQNKTVLPEAIVAEEVTSNITAPHSNELAPIAASAEEAAFVLANAKRHTRRSMAPRRPWHVEVKDHAKHDMYGAAILYKARYFSALEAAEVCSRRETADGLRALIVRTAREAVSLSLLSTEAAQKIKVEQLLQATRDELAALRAQAEADRQRARQEADTIRAELQAVRAQALETKTLYDEASKRNFDASLQRDLQLAHSHARYLRTSLALARMHAAWALSVALKNALQIIRSRGAGQEVIPTGHTSVQ